MIKRSGRRAARWLAWFGIAGILSIPLGCTPSPAGPPNLLLVSLDTLRADRLGVYGNADGLSPNLDAFAAEGVTFTSAYSQSTVTGPSHASVFTSRYPSELSGATRAPVIRPDMYTLPEVLGAYGYQTAARVAGGDMNPSVGPRRGFASYESSVDFGSLFQTVPMAVSWLDKRDAARPFFLFVHGYDAHATYMKPTPYGLLHTGLSALTPIQTAAVGASELVIDGRLHASFELLDAVTKSALRPRSEASLARLSEMAEAFDPPLPAVSEVDQEVIRRTYDGAVAYADTWFGFLMARLRERGLLENTAIVVISDHGEALGEGGLFHRCCGLGDDLTHVPLLVRLPGARHAGQTVDAVVELVDLMPTLIELAGAEQPARIRGKSLVAALEGRPFERRRVAMSQGGLGLRLYAARSAAGRLTYAGVPPMAEVLPELLATAQLPGPSFEASPGASLAEQGLLRDELGVWLGMLQSSDYASKRIKNPANPVVTPPALRDSLRKHGYWDAE